MADVESPVQVGFAEFIARLMSEVFDSIITSQVDQEQRYAEMYASVALSEEAYAVQYLEDEDIGDQVAVFFPPREEDKDKTSAIYPGSPYLAQTKDQAESPAVMAVLGIQLKKGDWVKEGDSLFLSQKGVDTVYRQVGIHLASKHLEIAKQLISRGLPRIMVDSGRINGKLTFHLTETTQTQPIEAEKFEKSAATAKVDISSLAGSSLGTPSVKSVFTLPKARILPNVKLLVKQADDTSPQSSQVKANVYGEVEITFKTIT